MKRRLWLKLIAILFGIIFVWFLFLYVADKPIIKKRYLACTVCRTRKTNTNYLGIVYVANSEDNEFSRYYHKNADPNHEHAWAGVGMYRRTRTDGVSGFGNPLPLRLTYDAAFSILKALPTPEARKEFFESLNVPDRESNKKEYARISLAIMKLNDVYWHNHNKVENVDWMAEVEKVGLWPVQEPVKETPKEPEKPKTVEELFGQ